IPHATDFSEPSQNAFYLACSLARDYGSGLVTLHVEPAPALAYSGVMTPPPPQPDRKEVLARLGQLRAPDPKVPVEHVLAEGNAPQSSPAVAYTRFASSMSDATSTPKALRWPNDPALCRGRSGELDISKSLCAAPVRCSVGSGDAPPT